MRRFDDTDPPLVCPGEAASPHLAAALGGKALGLVRLQRAGQPVPPWLAVTTAAFDHALARAGLAEELAERLRTLEEVSAERLASACGEIRARVAGMGLPDQLRRALAAACHEIFPGEPLLAVRSSAVGEDGAGGSFAGLHASLLALRGLDAVLAAIPRVWASAFAAEALAYRRARGLSGRGIAMAVVVQRMVLPRASGALFTADPATGDHGQIVINAVYGAGEGLMSLGLPADTYRVDKTTLAVAAEIATKREELVSNGSEGGLVRRAVPPERGSLAVLAPEQVERLARAALDLERRLGRPQDLEFAIGDDGEIFFLQARPLTTLDEDGPAAGNRIVWDHENWAENFPGVTLPMTFSLTRRMERVQYRCFAEMMRVPREEIEAYQLDHDTALGYIRGRIFTNSVNRYRLLRLIPGIGFKRKLFYALLRVRPEEIDREEPEPSAARRWLVELPRLLRLFAGLARDFFRVDRSVDRLLDEARRFHARVAALDLGSLRPHELAALYREAEATLAVKWTPPLLNALFLRSSYLILKKLCASWCGDDSGSLVNELLRGEAGAQSARPLEDLLALAAAARQDPALARLFAERKPEELAELVPGDPRFRAFYRRVADYLERYPFKGAGEMKLEDPTLEDRPELLYRNVAEYLALDDPDALDPGRRRARERRAREEAERQAFGALGRSPLRRLVLRRLLGRVRALDRRREEVKFLRLQLMSLFREVLRTLGRRLAEEGLLEEPKDIFYLTLEELLDHLQGASVTVDLRSLVALRRRELETFERHPAPDDRFETYGLVYHRNRYRGRGEPVAATRDGRLRGTGCSRGRASGEVRVLRSPEEATGLAGCILAVERIHAGWVPVLPTLAGLLVERGEILSHAATVARELGIPTVIGIPRLTEILASGQRVTIDGTTGTVSLGEKGEGGGEPAGAAG